MTDTLDLHVTPEQYACIQKSEAIVVRHYKVADGRIAKLVFIGTKEECEDAAGAPSLLLVPDGMEYDGDGVIDCNKLIPVESVVTLGDDISAGFIGGAKT